MIVIEIKFKNNLKKLLIKNIYNITYPNQLKYIY